MITWISGSPMRGAQEDPLDDKAQDEGSREGHENPSQTGSCAHVTSAKNRKAPKARISPWAKLSTPRRLENHDESHGGKSVEKTDADPVDKKLYKEIHLAPFRSIEPIFLVIQPDPPFGRGIKAPQGSVLHVDDVNRRLDFPHLSVSVAYCALDLQFLRLRYMASMR